MFKWLFNKPKPAGQPATSPEPSADAAAAPVAAPAAPSAPLAKAAGEAAPAAPVSAPSSPAPTIAASDTAVAASLPAAGTGLQIGGATALRDVDDCGVPAVGMSAVALSGSRMEPAEIIKIQAGGRRVVARVSRSGVQTYSRRTDGRYWLEGAPAKTSRRLVLGATSV